jgi:hypothetical protein
VTRPPKTAMHRLYWAVTCPQYKISAFLSYPGGMGICPEYFWEVMLGDDVKCFTGPSAEKKMESVIIRVLTKSKLGHSKGQFR